MVLLGSIVTAGVCAAVFARGGSPERSAVAVVLAGLAASLGLQALLGFHQQLPVLLADVGLATGFIVLAHRYRRAWLGLLSLLALGLLLAHAALAEAPVGLLRLVVNGTNLVGLGVLAGGAVAEARGRRRAGPTPPGGLARA